MTSNMTTMSEKSQTSDSVHEEVQQNLQDYETQLFGFTPKSFVSGIYNAVSEYFMEALAILQEYFEKEFSDVMTSGEVADKMQIICKNLVTQIDKAFDTLETYLSTNIFCVPPNVVLPEDTVHMEAPVSQADHDQLQADITAMKNKILAVKLANAILKQRIQLTLDLQETFDGILQHLDQAQATARQDGVVDLRDSLSHCAKRVLDTIRILSNTNALPTRTLNYDSMRADTNGPHGAGS